MAPASRARLRDRAAVAGVRVLAATALRVPDPLAHRLASLFGLAWYLVAARRRRQIRANLRRVSAWAAVHAPGSPAAAAAADPRRLERLVRDTFRHNARYYLELLLPARYTAAYLERHLRFDDPAQVARLLRPDGEGRHAVLVAMHFGALELPALFLTQMHGVPVLAPMETIGNAAFQAELERLRSRNGIRIVPVTESRRAVLDWIGERHTVALVADRDVLGTGMEVDLFGAPAKLPVGPGLLAARTGAPVILAAVRRVGWGEYACRVIELDAPGDGALRERALCVLLELARSFERVVADDPEQWWTLSFPIWPDLVPDTRR